MLGIELRGGHRRVRRDRFVGSAVLGPQLEPAPAAIGPFGQPVDGEAEVRKYLVVDDVVEEYGIRVESVFRQDDTIVKCAVLADLCVPGFQETLL